MFQILPWLLLAILGILLLIDTYQILPMVVLFICPTCVRSTFDDRSLSIILKPGNSVLNELLENFKVLGFSLIGLKVEHTPLWGPTYREISLVSEHDNTYASIILHPDLSPASKYCYTPIEQGGMVFTRDFAAGDEAEGERISVKNVPEASPAELVSSHTQRLDMFHERGMTFSVRNSRQARLSATNDFYLSEYAKGAQRRVWWPRIRRWVILWGLFLLMVVLTILSL